MKGVTPLLAAEMGRRAIPAHLRPSFQDFENACKNRPAVGAADGSAVPEATAAVPEPAVAS
jgi:chemotaxis protein MotA